MIGTELVQIVHFALDNPPKAFHGTIINTSTYPRHTLDHTSFIEFVSELFTGILKTSVAMK